MLNLKGLQVVYLFALLSAQFGTVISQSSSIACSASSRPAVIDNSSKGWITSPNYPDNYSNSLDCQWLLSSPIANTYISLRFTDFDTELWRDYVIIYDGNLTSNRELARLSGYQIYIYGYLYTTTQRNMLLRFTSDASVGYRGFNATYWINATDSQVACDRNLQPFNYSTNTGVVLSANYPREYENDMDCRWLITATLNELVRLRFTYFWTEANRDYVYIYDGNHVSLPKIATLSGSPNTSSTNYTTSQRNMLLRFTSDNRNTYRGFNATFWSISAALQIACSRNLQPYSFTTSIGVITSENYPNPYFDNADCRWLVTAMESQVVQFQFSDFYTEYSFDYVTLYDGQNTYFDKLVRLSGEPSLSEVYSTSQRYMLIQFTSDYYRTYRGFSGSFWTAYPDSSYSSLPDYAIIMIVVGSVALFMIVLVVLNYKFHICDCKRKCNGNNNVEEEPTPEVQSQPVNVAVSVAYIASSDSVHETVETYHNPMCSICMEKGQNAVLLPCRHGNFCFGCAMRACSTNPHCPTCRQRVDNIMQIYR